MKPSVRVALPTSFAILLALIAAAPAAAQTVVVQHDFEDGTLQGWVPRGGGVLLTNTEEVGSRPGGVGTHSQRPRAARRGSTGRACRPSGSSRGARPTR